MPEPSPNPRATILVCYHKFSKPIIASEILRPIIVGAANMGANTSDGAKALQEKLESKLPKNLRLGGGQQIALDSSGDSMDCHATATALARNDSSFSHCERSEAIHDSSPKAQSPVLRDDSGDNISHLNPHFCELTAMYWAWKNVDSSYYGLFHYRRILDLSEQAQQIRTDYPIIVSPRSYNPKRQGLTSENITKLLGQYDIILPQGYKNHYDLPCDEGLDNYGIYAHYHYAKDLDRIIELIKSRHPEMTNALEKVLFTYPPKWHIANMFIMRKDLYNEYCAWLFSLLFDLSKETDLSDYTPYQARIYGFLSERMFNIWLEYQRQTTQPRILEAPMLLFAKHTKPLIGWEINEKYKRFYLFGLRLYKKRVNPKN